MFARREPWYTQPQTILGRNPEIFSSVNTLWNAAITPKASEGAPLTLQGSVARSLYIPGYGISCVDGSSGFFSDRPLPPAAESGWTVFFYAQLLVGGTVVLFCASKTDTSKTWLGTSGSEWSVSGSLGSGGDTLDLLKPQFVVFTSHNGVVSIYLDGVQRANSALSTTIGLDGCSWLRFASNNDFSLTATRGRVYFGGALPYALNAREVANLSVNVWNAFAPKIRLLPIGGVAPIDPLLSNLVATSITSTGAIPQVDYVV